MGKNDFGNQANQLLCSREKTAAIDCPHCCACIDIPGDAEPTRYLSEVPSPQVASFNVRRLTWSTRVDFCARNLPLTTLAAFFARAFPDEVYLPGAKVYATVSNQLDGVTLSQVAAASGLISKDAQPDLPSLRR